MSELRSRLLLMGLLGLLVAVVALRVVPALGGGGDSWWQQGTTRAALDDDLGVEVLELHTAQLQRSPQEFQIGRDPWRFGAAPKPEAPPPVARPKPKARPVERRPPPVAEPVDREPSKPQPPPVDVTFLGTFGPENRKIAVFFDGTSIYNAGRGDVLNQKYQVVDIGLESVDLGFVGFPDEPPARLAIGG